MVPLVQAGTYVLQVVGLADKGFSNKSCGKHCTKILLASEFDTDTLFVYAKELSKWPECKKESIKIL